MTDNSKTLLYKKIIGLSEMSVKSIDVLFEAAFQRQIPKGEIILKQGQVFKTILFVENGYVRTFVYKDGNQINTDFTFEGDFTTNLKSLRSGTGSDTTIQSGESTIIYEFDKDKLLKLYKFSPEIESFGRNF